MSESESIDFSVFEGKLVHPVASFEPATVQRCAQELNTPIAAPRIETFAWLLEVAAQLSNILGPQFALRGGTSAQLQLDGATQRASQDIDGIFRGTIEQVDAAMSELNVRFADCKGFLQFERQQRDFPPRDFCAWTCAVPAALGGQIYDSLPRRLLAVEISIVHADLPVERVAGTVFGIAFRGEALGLTRGALIGDKLLTLGPNTTGIRVQDTDRIARQFYDLDSLTQGKLTPGVLEDAVLAAQYFAAVESENRGSRIGVLEALADAQQQALWWGRMSLPHGPGKDVIREIRSWQGINTPVERHLSAQGWATRALRVGMLAQAISDAIQSGPVAAVTAHRERQEFVTQLFTNDAIDALINELAEAIGPSAKGLRGASPERVSMLALNLLGEEQLRKIVSRTEGLVGLPG